MQQPEKRNAAEYNLKAGTCQRLVKDNITGSGYDLTKHRGKY